MEEVTFASENGTGECHGIIVDKDTRSEKGLIVLHAWWGVNDEIVEHGRQINKQTDFVVLVPDLYGGKRTDDRREAKHFMDGLDWSTAVRDIEACVRFLRSRGCRKVGVTGFCMGGALSLLAAALVDSIDSAVSFYGIPKSELADLTKINIPIQGHFGEKDDVIGLSSPGDYLPLSDRLLAAGVRFELYVYEGVGHGFVHPSYKSYSEHAANLALSRMCAFMQRTLR